MKTGIILGYHEIACILVDELEKHNIDIQLIVGSFKKNDSQTNTWYRDIRSLADNKKIKILEKDNLNNPSSIKLIKSIKPDLIFCAYSNYILTEKIFNLPRLGCYNFHNSNLPKDRGRGAPIFSIMKGLKKTALTMHHISKKIDHGDIDDKEIIQIEKGDDIKRLYLKHNFALQKILKRQLPKIKKAKLKGIPQKKTKNQNNFWVEGKSDLIIFKEMSAENIINKINSLKYPFKGAKSYFCDKVVFIHDAQIYTKKIKKNFLPGKIVKKNNFNIIVKTKKGLIEIKEMCVDGRHMLPAHFLFLNSSIKNRMFY